MRVLAEDRKIWWLASYPKSGNTWVRMFLNAYVTGFPIDMNSAFQYIMGDTNVFFMQNVYCRPVTELTATEQIFIRPAALMSMLNMSASKHICLKTHNAKVKVEGMPLIPAQISAGAVYIIRDPRDIAISYSHHVGKSINEVITIMNEMQYISEHRETKLIHVLTTWSMNIKTWTDKNEDVPVTIIKYEDMLIDPKKEFVKILKGFGFIDIDKEKFDFALKQTTFSNLQNFEEKEGFQEKGEGKRFFRSGKAGQWKTVLTKSQIARIEKDHGETMEKYGYLGTKVCTNS